MTPREAKHALPDNRAGRACYKVHRDQGDALRSTRTAAHRSAGAARVVPTPQTSPRAAPPPRGPIFLRKHPQEAHVMQGDALHSSRTAAHRSAGCSARGPDGARPPARSADAARTRPRRLNTTGGA